MTGSYYDMFEQFASFLGISFLLLSPMLILGLFLAGLLHVLISRDAILKWLRDDSLRSVATSAAIGVPMPLCSCSVVPVVAELRRKGASRSACMSFLITAPETGADSILVTQVFFGPIVALVRPVISFVTAVVAGIFCIGLVTDKKAEQHLDNAQEDDHCGGHESLMPGEEDCYVSPSQLKASWLSWYRSMGRVKSVVSVTQDSIPNFRKVTRHIFRYGFVEVADDILFPLLVGVILGAALYLVIPDNLMSYDYARWLSYPVMVLVGVPLYICASASTPIAAALVAKGFSPGAALIFLMTGPATNTSTIAIIVNQFGVRFASVYTGAVIVVTVILGILIDWIFIATGITLAVDLEYSHSTVVQLLEWTGAIVLAGLIVWRLRESLMKSGYRSMFARLRIGKNIFGAELAGDEIFGNKKSEHDKPDNSEF